MRVSSWSLWLVLSAVAGIAESDLSSLRQRVNHPQLRLLKNDIDGGSDPVVLDATDAPDSDSTFVSEAPTETPVGDSNVTEAPAGNGAITEPPAGNSTLATEAPGGDDTEVLLPVGSPTPSTGFDSEVGNSTLTDAPGGDEAATEAPGGNDTEVLVPLVPVGSPAPSTGFDSEVVTPAPSPEKTPTYESPTYESPTYESPTYEAPTYEAPNSAAYTYAPYAAPTYPTPPAPVSEPPTEEYVPPDDDPIKNEDIVEEEKWEDSMTLEQMENDRNVLIALSTVAAFGFLLMILTAHQMMENPDGCCARYVSESWKESIQSESQPTFLLTFIVCIS